MPKAAFRFTALQAQDPAELGDFRPVARLGEGGMGQVFIAFSPGGHPAAVKVIRPEFARDAEFGERFEREVRAAQKVRGAHLAPLLDADPHAEQPWLATGFVAGPTLRDLVTERGPLPAPQVLLLAWGIAHALADIHTAHVVHRDLKPGNIMLDETGPKVIDFGIVKSLTQSVTYSSHSTRVGTPLYMSPEQAMGRAVGEPSDIFALGSTLYFLATGQEAFGAENEWGVAHRIVADDPDLSAIRSAPLRDLLTACLDKEPAERPPAPQILGLCERELGDDLGPGAWMRVSGAREAIQERTAALRTLARHDDDPSSAVTVPRPRDVPKTREATELRLRDAMKARAADLEPPVPAPTKVAKPPVPPEPKGPGRTGGVVAVHLFKLALAAIVLFIASANPIMTETWTSDSTGQQVSQVTGSFDWADPWRSYASGIPGVTSDWAVVPVGVLGTAVLIVCGLLYLLRLSSDSDYRAWSGVAAAGAAIWTVVLTLMGIFLIVMTLGVTIDDDNPAYDIRSVLEPGGWMVLLANVLAAEAIWHTSNRLDALSKAA
ncbi:serine/threonine protein kinase [Streptomyces xanthii]|uniref:Serine/threonine protein kinase n=1 Tax=Streptomyces xanthii TaxID=2768069 RepID=A0A7H1BCA1_9ACTN|nr:serine/threonine-protein kinase [Streptomyces xanthii]QNS06356.1 serine/threonine protein kinase [Streptomyces xanthii]